jgi:hypothetical protein
MICFGDFEVAFFGVDVCWSTRVPCANVILNTFTSFGFQTISLDPKTLPLKRKPVMEACDVQLI